MRSRTETLHAANQRVERAMVGMEIDEIRARVTTIAELDRAEDQDGRVQDEQISLYEAFIEEVANLDFAVCNDDGSWTDWAEKAREVLRAKEVMA